MRSRLARESQDTTRLREALDELSADLAREAYGRRREVALRLALLGREERICERLRRWMRRSRELASRAKTTDHACECHSCRVFEDVLKDAHTMLDAVDGEDDESPSNGQLTRLFVAQDAVKMLTKELTREMERRIQLERTVVQMQQNVHEPESATLTNDVERNHEERTPRGEPKTVVQLRKGLVVDGIPQTSSLVQQIGATENIARPPTPPPQVLDPEESTPSNSLEVPLSENINQQSLTPQSQDSIQLAQLDQPTILPEPSKPTISILPSTDTLPPHPLLFDLERVGKRYDNLQRTFRDCHLALQNLRSNMSDDPTPESTGIHAVINAAIERLYNYTEDARVELEIRVADEALLARGFEALLSIPGAMSPSPSSSSVSVNDYSPHVESQDLESEIRAFVEGTEPSVQKALHGFNSRLEDIQHDIAVIKLASHDLYSPVPVAGEPADTLRTARILDIGESSHAKYTGASSVDPTADQGQQDIDPFANLGLRVPMPRYVHKPPRRQNSQPRKSSGMHMLGLGLPYHVSEGGDTPVKGRVWSVGISLPPEGSRHQPNNSSGSGQLEVE